MMILEQNPRLGGAVDLGQLERLRELKDILFTVVITNSH